MSRNPKPTFAAVPERAVKDRQLGNAAFRVLAAIASYADQDGQCFPSLRRIGEDLGCCRSAVHKQVKILISHGYVARQRTRRPNGSDSSNHYQILYQTVETDSKKRQPHVDGCSPQVNGVFTPEVNGVFTPEVNPSNTLLNTPSNNILPMPLPKGKSPSLANLFQHFWLLYPRKVGKGDAEKAFKAALKETPSDAILAGTRRYADQVRRDGTPPKYMKYPAGWLRAKHWLDEDEADGRDDPDECFKGGETVDSW